MKNVKTRQLNFLCLYELERLPFEFRFRIIRSHHTIRTIPFQKVLFLSVVMTVMSYHTKLLSTDDTHWDLLIRHPVCHLRRYIRWDENLLTTMCCSHLPPQAHDRARWSGETLSFLLLFKHSWICWNLSPWNGVYFPFHTPSNRLTRYSFSHRCWRYWCVAPRLLKRRHSSAHCGWESWRWRGSLGQSLHDAATKFCKRRKLY